VDMARSAPASGAAESGTGLAVSAQAICRKVLALPPSLLTAAQ